MKKAFVIGILAFLAFSVKAQTIREFSSDTGLYVSELRAFTGSYLESSEVPDFERFIRLYDSISHELRTEIISTSNLMLDRRCRPRPHFIAYQRLMIQFFFEDKTSHGYEDWRDGYVKLLRDESIPLGTIAQWLSMTSSLLTENILYRTNNVTWEVGSPEFSFRAGESPKVEFDGVTLACYSGRDFIQILDAAGYVDPLRLEWVGRYGRVTWERTGMPDSEMNATLHSYRIDLKTQGYMADSVELYYPAIFEGIALGSLEDKVTQVQDQAAFRYPRFESYRNNYSIEDFIPGIDYNGGLSVEGSNLVGSGVAGEAAEIKIFEGDTLRIKAHTQRVAMNESFIRSPHTSVSIFFGEDSISHPDLALSFDASRDQLRLNKTEDFKSQGPYSDTYHKVDMNFDELLWNRGEPTMKMQARQGSSVGRASFESTTYFDYDFFLELQGMDLEHPLAQLYTYSRGLGGRTFAIQNYANYVGYTLYQVRHLMMGLSELGFVYYDDQQDLITVNQKTFDYITASMGRRDYDVMRFISRTEGASNAELDLYTKDLTISGVPVIFLSDSQNVRLIPKATSIVMKKNRSFQFDGVVDAGLFQFSGKDFHFDYDSFKIDMEQIDSLKISVRTNEYNQYGEPILRRIENAMENMRGQLLIDDPQNKSGLNSYPQYPTFTSLESSYIYFDDPGIQNGVYDRDEFYFELEPFTIDSLDNFNPLSIKPRGTFISAGILPPQDLEMTLRDDNSLGFYLEVPEEGIPLYGGLGTFYNEIEMSSSGLRGFGSFDYLTSTTWSDNFIMHPDSMMARSRRFLVREQREGTPYPYAENNVAYVKLFPERDLMEIHRIEETFRIFNDSIFHGGSLALAPSGLTGSGAMGLPDARLESDLFHYGVSSIRADSAGVRIKDISQGEFPFLTNDVSLYVDLNQRIGEFTARGDATLIEFPYNLYETRLDQFTWFMDRKELILTQRTALPENRVDIGIDSLATTGPVYVSTHPGQDSLHFTAPRASYNYKNRLLQASQVPFIEVADAYVFPFMGEVSIGYQATMNKLNHARILASRENRQHLIYDASVAVNGARDYEGSGNYDYRDAFGNSHKIYFERIWVDTSLVSRSRGTIDADDPFMLSPYFDFMGDVSMIASEPFLAFDGGTRIVHDCGISRAWLRFTSVVDPTDIVIPIPEQMQNTDLNKIFAGSLITRDSTHIYSTFLSGRKDYFDANITNASGFLVHDAARESYIIAQTEKLEDETWPGQYLRLETEGCRVYGEGKIDLTVDYGTVQLATAGNALHKVPEDEFEAHVVLGLDFFFSEDALNMMGREIDALQNLEAADLGTPHYRLAMKDLLGREMANDLERQLTLTGIYEEIPPAWKHTIFFNDLPLVWNQEARSFRYNGSVGIGNIGEIQVNKKVQAYVEFVEKGSGDIFDIYLRAGDNVWYYIGYSPGGLQVLSSNRAFNALVFDLKEGERRLRGRPGQGSYVYSLAAPRRVDLFIERFLEYEDQGN